MIAFLKRHLSISNIILGLSLLFVIGNTFYLIIYAWNKYITRYDIYYEPGAQFVEFKPILKGVPKAGYLTNKDMSREKNDGFYLQAQYYFSPTILELNNEDNELNILDYTNQIFVFYTVKKLKAKPLIDNNYGQTIIKKGL